MRRAVARLRKAHPDTFLEIEADTLEQARRALELDADIILLDNMKPAILRRALALIRAANRRTAVEISGGVTLANVRALASLGPDRISIGRLTHSAPALDLSLEIDR